MSNYHRLKIAGASYFFTVVTHDRKRIFDNENNIQILRNAFRREKQRRPFDVEAIVILPDHLHCLWTLPENDSDYSSRWREIKKHVTKELSVTRNHRNEGEIWQRRFWEHSIRDDEDWRNHMDYIHYNPVKHGYVTSPTDWRWSSFSKWIHRGAYDANWGSHSSPKHIENMRHE